MARSVETQMTNSCLQCGWSVEATNTFGSLSLKVFSGGLVPGAGVVVCTKVDGLGLRGVLD